MLTRLRRFARGALKRIGWSPRGPSQLRLEFSTQEDFARFVDDPRARKPFTRVDVRVEPWYAVRPDWSGRAGPLPSATRVETVLDPVARTARVKIRLAEPVLAASLVRAAFPVFYPVRRGTGWGGERVGLWEGAPTDQRWEPGGGVRALLPRKLKTKRFTEYEIVIDGQGEHWLGDLDGTMTLIERPTAPPILIDPKVHRPLDRRQPRHDTLAAAATIERDHLLVRAGTATLLDAPLNEPLTATDLRRLALVTDIDLTGFRTDRLSSMRVAELAAYGAILHDAPAGLALDPTLAQLVEAPFQPLPLLDHANRSLNQVRAVMRAHTRVLASRGWPSVSVLLSTRRPELLQQILEQLAAQDHPRVEVVLGCHGFPAPDRESFPEHLSRLLGPIIEFDAGVLFGDVLAGLSAAAAGELLSKVDDDDLYGPNHLSDLMTAWHYSEAQLVGRKLALVHYEDEDKLYVRRFFLEGYRWDAAGGASILARGDLAAVGGWRSQRRSVDHGLMTRVADAGGLVYTCSGPGYIHVRHAAGHTYSVDDTRFKELYTEQTVEGIPPAAYGVM